MKFNKTIVLALLASILLSFSCLSNATEAEIGSQESTTEAETGSQKKAEDTYGSKIGNKTLRALANISLGVIEIPKNIIIVSNRTNLLYGLTGGTGLGILNTAGRISVGVLDLLTFPLATKSITQPVYPWNKYLDVYTVYDDMFVLDF